MNVEKALEYLASTDEKIGIAKGCVKSTEFQVKTSKAIAFLDAKGNNVAEREARAQIDHGHLTAMEAHADAVADYATLAAKRERAILTIEVWRTQEASSRKGHM